MKTFDYRAFIGKHVLFSLNIEPELKGRITIGMNKFLDIMQQMIRRVSISCEELSMAQLRESLKMNLLN